MRYTIVILIMLTSIVALWSVKADQILKSPDVIAYVNDGQAFLMDVNTGNEVKIKTSSETFTMLWDKTGEHLYRAYVNQDNSKTTMETKIILYNISLPDLKETQLMETTVADNDVVNIKIAWGKDDSIYLIKTDSWENENKEKSSLDYACGYYSFSQAKYYPLEEKDGLTPDLYTDPLHQNKKFRDFDIEPRICQDKALGNHYELFIHVPVKPGDDSSVEWSRITNYLNLDGAGIVHIYPDRKPDYKVAPSYDKLLVSYPYYISDKKSTFYNTFLCSLNPAEFKFKLVNKELWDDSKQEWQMTEYNELLTQITMNAGYFSSVTDEKWYEWTKDGRLIYSKEESITSDKMVIGVSGLLLLDKPLKTYKADLPAELFYRYLP